MRQFLRFVLLIALVCASSLVSVPAHAQTKVVALQATLPTPGACTNGTLPHGALSLICIPAKGWNGDLMVFAHGYVAYNQPLGFYNLDLGNGIYLPTLAQQLGFAFATTSYRQNGLAILPGVDDVQELVAAFRTAAGRTPAHTYMVGGSEGGLVTTLLVERSPNLFSGGLALCGPIGNFQRQIDYDGDFRVLFDYFFPGILPGSAINIPQYLIDHWYDTYVPLVTQAVNAHPAAAAQLLATAHAPSDPKQPTTTIQTITGLLWYSVFATNDATVKLGGNPYGNRYRWYSGSNNDVLLNAKVARFTESPVARLAVTAYETSGNITIPLITMHTTGDPIIPFWHELLYAQKAHVSGKGSKLQIPIIAYGHCMFTTGELLGAFALLVYRVTGTTREGLPLNQGLIEHTTR